MSQPILAEDSRIPDPPSLHWAIVLAASIVTAGLFGAGWLVLQANWARRIRGGNSALFLSITYMTLLALGLITEWLSRHFGWADWSGDYRGLASLIFWIASVYAVRGELAAEPIGLNLGFIPTFFFGPLYFQYYLSDWNMSLNSGRPLGL